MLREDVFNIRQAMHDIAEVLLELLLLSDAARHEVCKLCGVFACRRGAAMSHHLPVLVVFGATGGGQDAGDRGGCGDEARGLHDQLAVPWRSQARCALIRADREQARITKYCCKFPSRPSLRSERVLEQHVCPTSKAVLHDLCDEAQKHARLLHLLGRACVADVVDRAPDGAREGDDGEIRVVAVERLKTSSLVLGLRQVIAKEDVTRSARRVWAERVQDNLGDHSPRGEDLRGDGGAANWWAKALPEDFFLASELLLQRL